MKVTSIVKVVKHKGYTEAKKGGESEGIYNFGRKIS